MATSKSVTKAAAVKPATTTATAAKAVAKSKAATRAKPAPKAKPVTKAGAAPKAATEKPARSRAKKPAKVPPEQRRNYIEVAAYHIAERRGFAPGNPLEDWIHAEEEIDRLIADGLLGG